MTKLKINDTDTLSTLLTKKVVVVNSRIANKVRIAPAFISTENTCLQITNENGTLHKIGKIGSVIDPTEVWIDTSLEDDEEHIYFVNNIYEYTKEHAENKNTDNMLI